MLRFRLSKTARVGVTLTRGPTQVLATSARFPYGVDAIKVPALRSVGNYGVRLSATDLAGNFSRTAGTITVLPKRGPNNGAAAHSGHPPSTGGTTLAGTG